MSHKAHTKRSITLVEKKIMLNRSHQTRNGGACIVYATKQNGRTRPVCTQQSLTFVVRDWQRYGVCGVTPASETTGLESNCSLVLCPITLSSSSSLPNPESLSIIPLSQ